MGAREVALLQEALVAAQGSAKTLSALDGRRFPADLRSVLHEARKAANLNVSRVITMQAGSPRPADRATPGRMQPPRPRTRLEPASEATHFLRPSELAERLRLPTTTINYWRRMGTGPPYLKTGRYVRYSWSDVEDWLRQQRTD
jgi:predicted DNA-binding transcriptional regulator AlpA